MSAAEPKNVQAINSFREFYEIINGDGPAVIDFWATWCSVCRAMAPVYDQYATTKDFEGVKFYKVNCDEQEQIAMEVGISAMPAFILFHKGMKLDEIVGKVLPGRLEVLLHKGAALKA